MTKIETETLTTVDTALTSLNNRVEKLIVL
jgi:hypothetical protein